MAMYKICALGASVIGLLSWTNPASAQDMASSQGTPTKFEGAQMPGSDAPTPADPYPLMAAGWGPEVGNGLLYSRWAEDWTGTRKAGNAPAFKAMPLYGEATLTLSSEARLRYDAFNNGQLTLGNDYQQRQFRGILGADLRFNPTFRLYGEVGTGQVEGRQSVATANFQNDASMQQLFVEARGYLASTLVGAMVGRQEFSDGPKQLISLSDGPNIHRTWNGVRLFANDERFRVGAFDLRATKLERGGFYPPRQAF